MFAQRQSGVRMVLVRSGTRWAGKTANPGWRRKVHLDKGRTKLAQLGNPFCNPTIRSPQTQRFSSVLENEEYWDNVDGASWTLNSLRKAKDCWTGYTSDTTYLGRHQQGTRAQTKRAKQDLFSRKQERANAAAAAALLSLGKLFSASASLGGTQDLDVVQGIAERVQHGASAVDGALRHLASRAEDPMKAQGFADWRRSMCGTQDPNSLWRKHTALLESRGYAAGRSNP